MELKINIPENISDVTLEQSMAYELMRENDDDPLYKEKVVNIFTGLDIALMGDISKKEIDTIYMLCLGAMDVQSEFVNRFVLDGIEFGFIPNIDKMTANEYTDAIRYANDPNNINKLMAVLFRPIKKSGKFNNYSIVEYNGTGDYAELMKQCKMNVVNGAMGFFLTLYQELEKPFLRYMKAEQLTDQSL